MAYLRLRVNGGGGFEGKTGQLLWGQLIMLTIMMTINIHNDMNHIIRGSTGRRQDYSHTENFPTKKKKCKNLT